MIEITNTNPLTSMQSPHYSRSTSLTPTHSEGGTRCWRREEGVRDVGDTAPIQTPAI